MSMWVVAITCMRPIPNSSQTEGEPTEQRGRPTTSHAKGRQRHPRMLSKTEGEAELDEDEIWIMVHEF